MHQGPSVDDLGDLQRRVMEAVWDLGGATVQKVRERLPRRKQLAYTTVLSVLQKLEKAGWLTHRAEGRVYVYVPAFSREQAGASSLRRFIQRVFGGDALAMFQHLLADERLSAKELTGLRRMIDQHKASERRDE